MKMSEVLIMSIKIQKNIRFIPFVNMITVFCWIGMCFKYPTRQRDFIVTLLKIFSILFFITMVRIIIDVTLKNEIANYIAMWVSGYFYFFTMSWFSVSAQQKILKQNGKEDIEEDK